MAEREVDLSPITARIDFSDPLDPRAPRLRHAFATPSVVLQAHEFSELRPLLDTVQRAAEEGNWCVGYLRYEAAPAFDTAMLVHPSEDPLAWFAIYTEALPWPENELGRPTDDNGTPEVQWQASCTRSTFDQAMAQIQEAINAGVLYQVNFTAALQGHWQGAASPVSAQRLFTALQRAQPGGYAAFLDTGDFQLLSVSPELFFDWQGGRLLTRPMKGTAARGATPEADAAQATALRASDKERAENLMIVDLLRNDLSRIAEPFSVRVERLFHVEALPSVWQMTSDVLAKSRPGTRLADVFAALFPCASITGAPKISAMRMIRRLEHAPRGVYCGAIGLLQPGTHDTHAWRATFNVPIRTLSIQADALRCGIGSGITAGSSALGEWREWKHKRAFVDRASGAFELLETCALDAGVLRHATAHQQRLIHTATHFAYPLDCAELQQRLRQLAQTHPQGRWRVRLLLNAHGQLQTQVLALEAIPKQVCLQLANRPLEEAQSEFVRFKTTRRAHYEVFAPIRPEVFDTILWNDADEITECTRGNIAAQLDGRWITPALDCGLLPGVQRAAALREGRLVEAVLRRADLPRVQAWAFLSSLRGWVAAQVKA